MKHWIRILVVGTTLLASAVSQASLVDLSTWQADGSGGWVSSVDGTSVYQTSNSITSIWHSNTASQGMLFTGQFGVATSSDDDFFGFVLGYDSGDLTSASADYLLIDWKQSSQPVFGGQSQRGLSISRVSGVATDANFWLHSGSVTELQRAAVRGNSGWIDNQFYNFELLFTANLVELTINGVKEISLAGSFQNGGIGFYSQSQERATFRNLTATVLQPVTGQVPEPSGLAILALMLVGLSASRRHTHK